MTTSGEKSHFRTIWDYYIKTSKNKQVWGSKPRYLKYSGFQYSLYLDGNKSLNVNVNHPTLFIQKEKDSPPFFFSNAVLDIKNN